MALADYRFNEGDDGVISYEVSCRRCGHDYLEVFAPSSEDAPAA
jgi:hypothetical protein